MTNALRAPADDLRAFVLYHLGTVIEFFGALELPGHEGKLLLLKRQAFFLPL